jgi:hypothetical protein
MTDSVRLGKTAFRPEKNLKKPQKFLANQGFL